MTLRELYPTSSPFDSGKIVLDDIHTMHYERFGNKDGLPVVFLHGGPGGGCTPNDHRFFDPAGYHIILFDQRGCGKSTPLFELKDNTTWHLVEDVEKLRLHLEIEKWVVFGGSWGSTLALAYSEKYTERCISLILRGVFTLTKKDLDFFYQHGANFMFADEYEKFVDPIPENERHDLLSAYYKRLTSDEFDDVCKMKCAKAWTRWEMATCMLEISADKLNHAGDENFALAMAKIESHFFINGGWMEEDNQLIKQAHKIQNLPVTIVNGRYDVITPLSTAFELSKVLNNCDFKIIGNAGHSSSEKRTLSALVEATDKHKNH